MPAFKKITAAEANQVIIAPVVTTPRMYKACGEITIARYYSAIESTHVKPMNRSVLNHKKGR